MTYQPAGEHNLARRIARERQTRGWSAGEVQRRLAQEGCDVPRNAVLRIEQHQRGVSVDELLGFGRIFGLTVEDLLTPLELIGKQNAERLAAAVHGGMRAVIEACHELARSLKEFRAFHESEPEAGEYLLNLLAAPWHERIRSGERGHNDAVEEAANDAISELWESVYQGAARRFGFWLAGFPGLGPVPITKTMNDEIRKAEGRSDGEH